MKISPTYPLLPLVRGSERPRNNGRPAAGVFFAALLIWLLLGAVSHGQDNAGITLSVKNNLITMRASNVERARLLKILSERTGIEIMSDPSDHETVTVILENVSLEEAVAHLAPNRATVFRQKDAASPPEIERVLTARGSAKGGGPQPEYLTGGKTEGYGPDYVGEQPQLPHIQVAAQSSRPEDPLERGGKIVPGEISVRFKKNASQSARRAFMESHGLKVKKIIKPLDYYVFSIPEGKNQSELIEQLRHTEIVDRLEPNRLIPLKTLPNDPDFSKQWSLYNQGQDGGTVGADIKAPDAWSVETGAASVVIAVVDTGVDYTHADLAANIWHNPKEIAGNGVDDDNNGYVDDVIGWDFVDSYGGAADEDYQTPDSDPMDRHGHGTHVAGIAAAVANNSTGIAGVSWKSKIMPVRAGFKNAAGDGVLESDDAAQAIIYAADNGAQVINLSWGDYDKSNLIEDAVIYAAAKGALVIASAGNENTNEPIYPAASTSASVMAVGATDNKDQRASFSNYGDWVAAMAPGVNIYSTYKAQAYAQMSGTSMAAPHVSGEAALLFAHFSGISALGVKARIIRSADTLPGAGTGPLKRINAYKALTADFKTPFILSLSSTALHPGDRIKITGDLFGNSQGNGKVLFSPGLQAEIISWSDADIVCRVPSGAQTGTMYVQTDQGASNSISVTVLTRYYDETEAEQEYAAQGAAKNWNGDEKSWTYTLPFNFPFFGKFYRSLYVSTNGFMDFTNSASSYKNSVENLTKRAMIAPLWDDLITDGKKQTGENIYIYQPSQDALSIRWAAERYETGDPVNVEALLYRDGRIRFNYGAGNANVSPTIGISGGTGLEYHLSSYNDLSNLNNVKSVLFTPAVQTFTVSLEEGWNLISLPLVPETPQVKDLIAQIADGVASVWGYADGQWHTYFPLQPEAGDLTVLAAGRGYWIKTSQPGLSLSFQGRYNDVSLPTVEGWNLAGFSATKESAVNGILPLWGASPKVIWSYKSGRWQAYYPSITGASDLEYFKPGRGYWMKW